MELFLDPILDYLYSSKNHKHTSVRHFNVLEHYTCKSSDVIIEFIILTGWIEDDWAFKINMFLNDSLDNILDFWT